MLHWLYTYVASVCFKYFSCFKHMFQVFYLDVAYVAVTIHIFCNRMFINVASILDVCCSKCFMLQDQAREVGADGGGPLGHSGPATHGSEASMAAPTCMCRHMHTTAAGGLGRQAWQQ
jgi:hypothetical protein